MRPKTKLPPEVELPEHLSPFGRLQEVTKRLLAVPKEEIDRREVEYERAKQQRKPEPTP